jgi:hypothetical protein
MEGQRLMARWKDGLRKRIIGLARSLLPMRVWNWLVKLLRADRLPDRVYMERELVPAIARKGNKVLFVGCQRYTRHYPALIERTGRTECWTIDIDPTVARWGAPGRHVIGGLQDAPDHWPPASFVTIVLNGVFGFGIDNARDQDEALRVCRFLLRSGGWLILGWNIGNDASEVEPSRLSVLRQNFHPAAFQGLAMPQTFPGSTHVYESFVVGADTDSRGLSASGG